MYPHTNQGEDKTQVVGHTQQNKRFPVLFSKKFPTFQFAPCFFLHLLE